MSEEPRAWLGTVTLAGSATPVRVVLEERDGHRVLVRQVDPGEPEPPRIPLYEGDELVVMQAISHVGAHTNDIAADETGFLFGLRVVPVRREGGVVFARSLRRGEVDTGQRVHVRPGETLTFEAGAIAAELDGIDEVEPADESGTTPLTPVLFTWFQVGSEHWDQSRVRYLLAAARRLDTANLLLRRVEACRWELARTDLAGPALRRALLELIGAVEMHVVALGRAVDMVVHAGLKIACKVPVPAVVTSTLPALRAIRNAYEHIEDRALGTVFGKPSTEALTIFDHHALVVDDEIRYGSHSLDLIATVPQLLVAVRQYLKDASSTIDA